MAHPVIAITACSSPMVRVLRTSALIALLSSVALAIEGTTPYLPPDRFDPATDTCPAAMRLRFPRHRAGRTDDARSLAGNMVAEAVRCRPVALKTRRLPMATVVAPASRYATPLVPDIVPGCSEQPRDEARSHWCPCWRFGCSQTRSRPQRRFHLPTYRRPRRCSRR